MKYVELAYPIYKEMPVYPGLPEFQIARRDSMEKGDEWNGSVLSIYLHAGTHVDAPWHYMGGDAPGIDAIPIDRFFYQHPMVLDVPARKENDLISLEQLKAFSPEIYEADLLIFNTHSYLKRAADFMAYATDFASLSYEAAEFIREKLPQVKAVAIDTLSIENLSLGKKNGYRTHKAFLDPNRPNHTVLIYEDINPAPVVGKKLLGACCTPLRIVGGDACVCNLVAAVDT